MKTKIIIVLLVFLISCTTPLESESGPSGDKYVLDNGLVVILKKNPNTDLTVFDLFVKTGTLTESVNGISYLTSKSLFTGTHSKNREELTEFLEKVGGSFKVIPSVQYNDIRITVPSSEISTALKFLSEILIQPSFAEVEKEKKFILDEIKEKKDNPQATSDELLYSNLFAGTPYANPVEGTEESIGLISTEDVIDYYDSWYVPNNMILVVAGNFNDELISGIVTKFGGLSSKEIPLLSFTFKDSSGMVEENKYVDSFYVNIGYRTVAALSEDYIKLKVLHGVLGQGPASRLFYELREKQGLAYRLDTRSPTIKDTSVFMISAVTRPSELDTTIKELLKQVERLKNELISNSELQEVKERIKGYYFIQHQKSYDVAEYLGLYEIVGLGYAFDYKYPLLIDMVTAQDLQEVALRYLNNPTISIVGPLKEVEIKSLGE